LCALTHLPVHFDAHAHTINSFTTSSFIFPPFISSISCSHSFQINFDQVTVRVVEADFSASGGTADAIFKRISEAVGDIDVGLLINNAGGR
jgi:hypothetical protein